jgi:3-oxoacyl-[acyl-carrier protein] reductase
VTTDQHPATASRVAVVTGGSRGIGRQVVKRLADDGYSVVVNYSGNDEAAKASVEAANAGPGQAYPAQADVADEVAISALFDKAEETYGGIDVVVNAAGQMQLSPLVDLDLAVLDEVHRTNIRGTFVVAQQAARRIRPGGAIVTFSTSVVGTAFPNYSVYAASKAAVEAMTLILARELRGRDITVNTVAPGPTATDMFLTGKDEETIARMASTIPLGRLGTPGDIAELVAFLASPVGHWVNGQTIRANGGLI